MRLLPTALAALALLAPHAVRADEAREAVNKAIAAHGGEKALQEQSSMTWKAKGKLHAMGQVMPYTADYSYKAPNKLRFDLAMNFQGQDVKLLVVSNGTKAWEVGFGQEREMPEEKFKEFRHTAYAMNLTMLLPLNDPAYKLTALGESQEEGKTLVGVKVSREGERNVNLFFDKATGMLHKSSFQGFNEFEMKPARQDVYFLDYKAKDGKQFFSHMVIKLDGKPHIEEEMSDGKTVPLDDKLFEKP